LRLGRQHLGCEVQHFVALFVRSVVHGGDYAAAYLPMQKREKISPSKSSALIAPVR
jgi:hypothetical protein